MAAAQVAAAAEREKERRNAARVPCPHCGQLMAPHRKHCGASGCRRAFANEKQREFQHRYKAEHGVSYAHARFPEQRRRAARERKLRERSAFTESFSYSEIFDRDSWTCGICGEPVDRELRHPNPMAASLDHVLPIAQGGKHARDNVQCSHYICNVRRGDRPLPLDGAGAASGR